ncbi:MAG: two-component regulator propeller domain-containing protein, partial [Crocinitomicaceae bacterium]
MKPKKSLHKTKTVNIFLLLIFSFLAFTASCKNSNDLIKPENSFKFKQGIISVFEDSKGNFWFGTKD